MSYEHASAATAAPISVALPISGIREVAPYPARARTWRVMPEGLKLYYPPTAITPASPAPPVSYSSSLKRRQSGCGQRMLRSP